MTALPPIAVRDATAAAMLELPLPRFRELVAAGALPQPKRIGPHERWSVEQLQAIVRGDAARPDGGLEI